MDGSATLRTSCKSADFPTGVRKDVDKSDTTSPFVRFIWELQELIPQEFRRGSHSKVALATLISKAIRGR